MIIKISESNFVALSDHQDAEVKYKLPQIYKRGIHNEFYSTTLNFYSKQIDKYP